MRLHLIFNLLVKIFNQSLSKKFFVISVLLLSVFTYADQGVVQATALVQPPFKTYPINLRDYAYNQSFRLSTDQLISKNDQTIQILEKFHPPKYGQRANILPLAQAKQLYRVVTTNKVTNPDLIYKYEPPGVGIGYCFGRATFSHLMLLKMGLQKESIYKIWAVGSIVTPQLTWEFHVATVAYTAELGWVTFDTYFGEPLTIREWVKRITAMSTASRVSIHITQPEKFSLTVGKYSRIEMGLNTDISKDWYRHYFVNMLASLRESKLNQLGLVNLNN